MIQERLADLTERLPAYDSRVRRHEPGGVHKMRVTLRRLRSLLATSAPLFDAPAVTSLREELKWVGGELGAARDCAVVRKRLAAHARSPQERAVAERAHRELAAAETAGLERSIAALDSERYSALLRDLNSFVADPPWSPHLDRPAEEVLRSRVLKDLKRLRRRVEAATDTTGSEHHAALHEVRKAAKRLRYSAEVLVPAYGDDARRVTRAAKRIQTDLGEVQDSAVTRAAAQRMARASGADTDEVFVLGELSGQQRLLAKSAEARSAKTWAKLSRKKHRRWLE